MSRLSKRFRRWSRGTAIVAVLSGSCLFGLCNEALARADGAPSRTVREQALDTLDRRLAHYVHQDLAPAIRARLVEDRSRYLRTDRPEVFVALVNADLYATSHDRHLQIVEESESRDAPPAQVYSAGAPPSLVASAFIEDGVAVVRLTGFAHDAEGAADIDAALASVHGARALILDLRDNGGGGEAGQRRLMGHLAPVPLSLETIELRHCEPDPGDPEGCVQNGRRDAQRRSADAVADPAFPHTPMFVLTSKRTFSAAEAVAYNLQAVGRATIVGETTGGGANPSAMMDLGPWYSVILPIGVVRLEATGGNWEGVGVTPDVRVSADDALGVALRLARSHGPSGGD